MFEQAAIVQMQVEFGIRLLRRFGEGDQETACALPSGKVEPFRV